MLQYLELQFCNPLVEWINRNLNTLVDVTPSKGWTTYIGVFSMSCTLYFVFVFDVVMGVNVHTFPLNNIIYTLDYEVKRMWIILVYCVHDPFRWYPICLSDDVKNVWMHHISSFVWIPNTLCLMRMHHRSKITFFLYA